MLRVVLSITFSLLLLGCGVPRPKGLICQVDEPRQRLICYDLEKDYSDDGELKPEAVQQLKPLAGVKDVDRFTVFDPDTWAEIKIWMRKTKERYDEGKNE